MTEALTKSEVREMNELHADLTSTTLEKAIRVGELLTRQKANVKYGQWLPWLKANVVFSKETAQRYMRVFERRDEIRHSDVSELSDAYRLLTAPGEPEEPPPPVLHVRQDFAAEFKEALDKGIELFQPPRIERELKADPVPNHKPAEKTLDLAPAPKPHVANNSGENEWYTPPIYIEAARKVMGGIDVDPASCKFANKTVKARQFYDIETDGLAWDWPGKVWLNPPYVQPLVALFTERAAIDYEQKIAEQVCVLVNNATETAWFHRMMRTACAICFLKGRIKFLGSDGLPANTPLQGQAIVYFGDRTKQFNETFSELGFVLLNK